MLSRLRKVRFFILSDAVQTIPAGQTALFTEIMQDIGPEAPRRHTIVCHLPQTFFVPSSDGLVFFGGIFRILFFAVK